MDFINSTQQFPRQKVNFMEHINVLMAFVKTNSYQLRAVCDETGTELELWTMPALADQHQHIVGRVKADNLEAAAKQLMEKK